MAWYKPQQHPPPCVLELGEMISVCVVKHWLCCTNAEGATVCPRDLIASIQHSESNSDRCADRQPTCSGFQHFPWCDQDVLQVPLCLKLFFLIILKGANFESYRLETLMRGFLKCHGPCLFWTFSSRSLLLGSFCFPSSLLFLSLAMLNFPGFHGKMPDF